MESEVEVRQRIIHNLREAREYIHEAELRLPRRNLGEPDEKGPSLRLSLRSADYELRDALRMILGYDDEMTEGAQPP